jgi:hypothetical protein
VDGEKVREWGGYGKGSEGGAFPEGAGPHADAASSAYRGSTSLMKSRAGTVSSP